MSFNVFRTATLINSLNVYWGWRDDRRDRKVIKVAEAQLQATEEKV
ncbi:hypothetical protein ACFVHS_10695 [Streptomyces sp. NPDC057746]